jgi:hypothetical protein
VIFGGIWGQNVISEVLGSRCNFGRILGLKCDFGKVWGQNVILWNFGVNV